VIGEVLSVSGAILYIALVDSIYGFPNPINAGLESLEFSPAREGVKNIFCCKTLKVFLGG
jgi:hypothetical protein